MAQRIITVEREEFLHHVKLSCQIPTLLENIMACKIISSAALEAGIQVEPEKLQQAADDFRLANQLHNTDDTWSWLQKHHLSLDDFEILVYTNALSAKLAQHLFAEQVEPFFYEHQLDYTGVVMDEILLKDEDLVMELFYALQEGEVSFHELTQQYHQSSIPPSLGEEREIRRRTQLKPDISATVFAATPPQILKPITTTNGTHLIWVKEIIQPQLDDQLRYQILSDLFSDWLKQQIAQVEIVTNFD